MKVHYINILLFALPLNIFVTLCHANTHKKPSITPRHIQTTRLLCECELYMSNYDSDPEMKRVMQQFHDRTTQRFQEYDERLQEKRQICKDKCDKVIQKIILKDKIEKQIAENFSALETNITTNDIPTCVCEKSLADKTEKFCLKCGTNLGGIVAPSSGVLGGIAEFAISVWKPKAIEAAIDAAITDAVAAGTKAGINFGIQHIITELKKQLLLSITNSSPLNKAITAQTLNNPKLLIDSVENYYDTICNTPAFNNEDAFCSLAGPEYSTTKNVIDMSIESIVGEAKAGTTVKAAQVAASETEVLKATNIAAVDATSTSYHTIIISSIVAIVVIVLVMLIIYLILRYRRKKKMKKKLQYIKLLKE
ncbi:PIR protein, putative [Plasmodium sp. gorilla clade G1]|nr:PIR protein, putative [Plasmodium sp. gorilla clade G1]